MEYKDVDLWPSGQRSPRKDRFAMMDIEKQELTRHEDSDNARQPLSTNSLRKSTVFLDGLRGVAALCVFTQHFMGGGDHFHGYGENEHRFFISLPFIRIFYSGGAAAVAIFFVLSGYVLSQSAVKLFYNGQRQYCKKSLISAIVRRPFRLYLPCFMISFVIALLMHLPYNFYPELPWISAKPTIGRELVFWFVETIKYFNPFQAHGWNYGVYYYDVVLWTIPLELKGSMLIYALTALCCFGLSTPVWSISLLVFLAIVCLELAWWTGACFIGGLLLSIIDVNGLDNIPRPRTLTRVAKSVATHALFVLGYYLLSQPASDGHPEYSQQTPGWRYLSTLIPASYDENNYYRFWQSYGAILFIYGTLRLNWLQAIFSTRPLRYLGKVSFMLYIIHLPMMYVVGDRWKRLVGEIMMGSDARWWDNLLYIPDLGPRGLSLRWSFDWCFMLAVSLAVAHFATRVVDEPCVRLGKRISQKLGLN